MVPKAILITALVSCLIILPSCGGEELDQTTNDSINVIVAHRIFCESLAARIKRMNRPPRSGPVVVVPEPPAVLVSGFRGVADTHNGLIRRLSSTPLPTEEEFEKSIDQAFFLERLWLKDVNLYLHQNLSVDEVALKQAWLQIFHASQRADQKQKEAVLKKVGERATMRSWNQL